MVVYPTIYSCVLDEENPVNETAKNEPVKIAAIIGSLRVASANRLVFEAATRLIEPGVELVEIDIGDVPLFNADIEADGDPESVAALKLAVDAADGLIVFTPEYNRSIPAVTKNAIDWLSRGPGDSALSMATVGIVAATPGRNDAPGARAHLAASVGAVTKHFHEPTLGISSITRKVTDGVLTDEETARELAGWLAGFVAVVKARRDVAQS